MSTSYNSYNRFLREDPFSPTNVLSKDGNNGNTENTRIPNHRVKTGNKGTPGKSRNKSTLVAKTYKLPADLTLSVERVAYWQRRKIQDVVAECIKRYLKDVPEEDLQPIPNDA